MAKLTYITNASLDGYVEDANGGFDFGPMDDELFAAYTDLLRPVGTYLYGRRLYETMAVWETEPALQEQSALHAAFAEVWKAGRKVVYSTTLTRTTTADTHLVRTLDVAEAQKLKDGAGQDLTIGGAQLASQALAAGLVDECVLLVWPVAVGGGKPALGLRQRLELLEERRFRNGVVLLRYRPSPP